MSNTKISDDLRGLARALGGVVRQGQVLAPGPGHSATDRSLSVKLDTAAPDGFIVHSFAGDDPIQCRDYVRGKMGLPPGQANGHSRPRMSSDDVITQAVMAAVVTQSTPKKIVATYDYKDESGALLYQVVRYEPKTFRHRQPDGKGGWIWKGCERRILYCLPALLQFPDATVFLTEGEKDADRVASLGHCSTTVASGDWAGVEVKALVGRDVLVLEDNDEAGRKKALAAAKALHGTAKTIRIVRLPNLPDGDDVSDWLEADPSRADKLVDICFDAPEWKLDDDPQTKAENRATRAGTAQQAASETEPKLALTFFDQLIEAKPKPWLIKNVIARGEASSWIASPGKGKSALLTDIAIHLAGGKDWRGYRTKSACGVLYLALERADLIKRRLFAHRLRDELPDLPIAVGGHIIDLMSRNCVGIILAAIKQAEQHFGGEVGLVIIDTYPKGIAAGGGDENQAKDQNIVLANLRRILDQANIHIAGIGHTGKDESRGERGSNARLADVDVFVQVAGDTVKTATVKKANDQPEGTLTSFRLEPIDFGTDEDGDPLRTFILAKEIVEGALTERPLSDQQRLALEALAEAILAHGSELPAVDGLPRGLKAVSAEQWRGELYRRNVLDQTAKNPRARFSELRLRLAAKKLIGTRDELVWLPYPEEQP
jgi:hypothetical protein